MPAIISKKSRSRILLGVFAFTAETIEAISLLQRNSDAAFPTCSIAEKDSYTPFVDSTVTFTDNTISGSDSPTVIKIKKPYSYETPEISKDKLAESLKKHEKLVIVFYAPWCPHCQDFVLQGGPEKDPAKAPLEKLHKEWTQNSNLSSVQLVRYNTETPGANPPPAPLPAINAIPTIVGIKNDGSFMEFKGQDPSKELQKWAEDTLAG